MNTPVTALEPPTAQIELLSTGILNQEQDVPRTFFDMFCFNAAVMDLLQPWMYEVLDCFDIIVLNAGNTFRLQEECDILTLKMAKVHKNPNLSDS